MDVELFLKTLKNELIQALLWLCCSAHVIRDERLSHYSGGVVPAADDHLLTESGVTSVLILNFFED